MVLASRYVEARGTAAKRPMMHSTAPPLRPRDQERPPDPNVDSVLRCCSNTCFKCCCSKS